MSNQPFAICRRFALMLACAGANAFAAGPADLVYRNGVVFTADASSHLAQAVALREGRIVYAGTDEGTAALTGPATRVVDLQGRFVMPGIVDGHMHPLDAGINLLKCSLDYASLTIAQLQARVQDCLDKSASQGPDAWLEVVGWFQESMRPPGVHTSRATLDALKTTRPIIVRSTFGHTVLANTRALQMAGYTAATPDPAGGRIWREADGTPAGLLEDTAFVIFDRLIPKPTPEENVKAAVAALAAMNRQGVTSFLDAWAHQEDFEAFTTLAASGRLTARAHLAPSIDPGEVEHLDAAIARVLALRQKYDGGAAQVRPGITVRNAKFFLDGVIAVPALTGSVVDPYRRNVGTPEQPQWVPGDNRGPTVYFPAPALRHALIDLARAGIDPHLHADGDGAVRAALDAIDAMRQALPASEVRPAIAHDELVDPADLPRFKALGAIPVLSFQWEKPAGDTIGLTDYFGPERMDRLEPAGVLAQAGARIAFGSDWPVDMLDEWFAFKVGVTRTNVPDAPAAYRGRLGKDPGLTPEAVLRAATIGAAYELHEEDVTGSIEAGKFADLLVLDRNPLTIPAEDIAHVQVLQTMVGGAVVYRSPQWP